MEYTEEEIQIGLKYAAQIAYEETRAKVMEELRAEAIAEAQAIEEEKMKTRIKIAQAMIGMNLPQEVILAATGLSAQDYEKLVENDK